jgi:hypothetical protein
MTRHSWDVGALRIAGTFVAGLTFGIFATGAAAQSDDGGASVGADIGGVSADVGVGRGGVSADVGADVGGGRAGVGADVGGGGADVGADIGGGSGGDTGGAGGIGGETGGGGSGGNTGGAGSGGDQDGDASGGEDSGNSPGGSVGGGADDSDGGTGDRAGTLPGDHPGIRPIDRRYSYFTALDVRTPAFRRYRAAAERNRVQEAGDALSAATARPITEDLVVHVNGELDVQTALTPGQIVAAANGVPAYRTTDSISSAADQLTGDR